MVKWKDDMCGRFELLTYDELVDIVESIARGETAELRIDTNARSHAHPGSTVVLLEADHGAGSELGIAQATWGFKAEWSGKPLFNTRIESMVGGAPFWREAAENGRCIIPAAAFFEPHASETIPSPRTGRPMKRPYRFSDVGSEPLLLAGVQDGGHCSVVTCEPNRWVSPVHNRMPLVLRFEEVPAWLSPNWTGLADRSEVELAVLPEHTDAPEAPEPPGQLTLF